MKDGRVWTVDLDHGDIVRLRLHDAWDAAMIEVDVRFDDAGEVPIRAGQLRSLALAAGQAADLLEARERLGPVDAVAEAVQGLVDHHLKNRRPE